MNKKKQENPVTEQNVKAALGGAAAGSILHVLTIRTSQHLAKALGLHSGLSLISSILGGAVLSSSFVSSTICMVKVRDFIRQHYELELTEIVGIDPAKLFLSTVGNLAMYRIVYDKSLQSVLPSHLMVPGSFAGDRIPLMSEIVSKSQKRYIQGIGALHGCHHCGVKVNHYISDHIPSTKFLPEISRLLRQSILYGGLLSSIFQRTLLQFMRYHPQSLYAQCRPCSYRQGGHVNHKSFFKAFFSKRAIVLHKFRCHHYFFFIFPLYPIMELIDVHFSLELD